MNCIWSNTVFLVCLVGLMGPSLAQGARATDMPAQLHGEVGIGLEGWSERGRMTERGIKVGDYRDGRLGPTFDLRFGILPGLEVFGSIPLVTSGARSYSDVASVCGDERNLSAESIVYYDTDAEGTILNETPCAVGSAVFANPGGDGYSANPLAVNVPSYTLEGLNDVVLGLRFSPLHEADLGKRGQGRAPAKAVIPSRVTWRVELGLLINTGGNFYEGKPGAGSNGYILGTSFSRKHDVSDPYISVLYKRYRAYDYTFTSDDGTINNDLTLKPANTTDVFMGIEITPYEDPVSGAAFSVDFATGFYLESQSKEVSGTVLPTVVTSAEEVDGTYGEAINVEDSFGFQWRLQLHYQIFRYLRLEAGGTLVYLLPHQLESGYNVVLGRNVLTRFGVGLQSTF